MLQYCMSVNRSKNSGPKSPPSSPPPIVGPLGTKHPLGQPGVAPQVPLNQDTKGPTQGYPGGQSLYPDVSQLPQPVPQAVVPAGGDPRDPDPNQVTPSGAPLTWPSPVPVQLAPSPPGHSPITPGPPGQSPVTPSLLGHSPVTPSPPGHSPAGSALHGPPSSNQGQVPLWANLKDGEAPPGCVISWKGGCGLKISYLHEEGHIVSHKKPFEMAVYKKTNDEGGVEENNLLGMVEVLGCWRLRLHGKYSFCLHTSNDTYVFLDDSTCTRRIVIIELPHDVSIAMRAELLALVQEMSDMREEQEGVLRKISTNVGAVYTDVTKKLNAAVKNVAPGAHKSTKWLRQGTSNLVRKGSNLVSKGMHMIVDQIPGNETEHEEELSFHSELMEGLMKYQKAVESGNITYE